MVKKAVNSVYFLGLGAMGSLYASKLYDTDPALVKIIASQSRISSLQHTGVNVNGKPYSFSYIMPGDQSQPPADLIIIAVKYSQLQQAIADIREFIGPHTIVISLLNGIFSEEVIGREIGMEHLLYAYGVGMDAVRQDSTVNYASIGKIFFGEKNNEVLSERVQAVKALFERAGIPYHIPVDMQRALWSKLMMNAGISQVSVVLRAPYGIFRQNEEACRLMVMAAEEVLIVSQYAGINLSYAEIDEFVQIVKGLNPAGKTSMLQDIEAGRKTEVNIFAGTVVELGKKYNVPTPVNETFLNIILAMEGMQQ